MKHRILTCKNHPALRWSCKDEAWSGFYNGCRRIFYCGVPSGKGMFHDGSGLDCTVLDSNGNYIPECECHWRDLILAPEDQLVLDPPKPARAAKPW